MKKGKRNKKRGIGRAKEEGRRRRGEGKKKEEE